MDDNGEQDKVQEGWVNTQSEDEQQQQQQQYQASSSNQAAHGNFPAAQLAADSQFHSLGGSGSSFQVYQAQPSTSGFGRSSPQDNFASSSSGNETIHQHFTTPDGQVIRIPQPLVTVLLGNQVSTSACTNNSGNNEEQQPSTSHAAALHSLQVQLQQLQAAQSTSQTNHQGAHQQQQQTRGHVEVIRTQVQDGSTSSSNGGSGSGTGNLVAGPFSLLASNQNEAASTNQHHHQHQHHHHHQGSVHAIPSSSVTSVASSSTSGSHHVFHPQHAAAANLLHISSSRGHQQGAPSACSSSMGASSSSIVVDSTDGNTLGPHHSVGNAGHPLFHVISGLPHLQQSEASSSEATPLSVDHSVESREAAVNCISLALQQTIERAKQEMSDVYSTEPDTTQEDSQLQIHNHHDEDDSYGRADSSHLGLDSSAAPALDSTISSAIDSSGLDGSIDDSNLNTPHDHSLDPTMDPQIDTTGIPATPQGPDEDGLQMLVTITPVYHGEPSTSGQSSQVTSGENKENELLQVKGKETRKSSRLAKMDRSSSPTLPRFVSRPYNPNELWCEDCQMGYATECSIHRMQMIFDKVVLSRAWASLPPQLQIFRLGDSSELGVFAKKPIPKRTQFGPYVADIVSNRSDLDNEHFLLQVDRDDGVKYFDSRDENRCNWMMFVRPATNWAEQNLIVYQFGVDLYFATMKPIEPKQELKVWYAAHYAKRLCLDIFQPSLKEREEMEESGNKWPCYECNKRFKTSALLHKHLAVHDASADYDDVMDDSDNDVSIVFGKGKAGKNGKVKRRLSGGIKTEPKVGHPAVLASDDSSLSAVPSTSGINPSKLEELSDNIGSPAQSEGGDSNTSQNWKKKRTSIYLNKYKKYRTDAVKKSIKSLYKKKGPTRTGVNEWICTHCDLTFNNPSLLNLHTLTHAAEDVDMLDIQRLAVGSGGGDILNNPLIDTTEGQVTLEGIQHLTCPVCKTEFDTQQALIQHASEHGKALSKRRSFNPNRPYRCSKCWKSFSDEEKLTKHMLCHGREDSKPLECEVCHKRFLNNSARACHMKTHSENKFYTCFVCLEGFDRVVAMKEHGKSHADPDGMFRCKECGKVFNEYMLLRKHMRAFHGPTKYPCPHCEKIFPRPDKLKLHMLKHSSHREFMCDLCGRQFKRKDKLKEHAKRMHGPERDERLAQNRQKLFLRQQQQQQKFAPKVNPNDYHRFIYKCHACMLGFKRRGMLVNHLAKRHPDIKPEDVPELNLPILRTQKDYFCQYCDKVYKSSSKRKAHILKIHPGAQLPHSGNVLRKTEYEEQMAGYMNPSYSQTVGSVTTMPHQCEFCHKQYASRAKLMQHQRKVHQDLVPMANSPLNRSSKRVAPATHQLAPQPHKTTLVITSIQPDGTATAQNIETDATIQIQTPQQVGSEGLQGTDLLTQAMSELTSEYRPVTTEYQLQQRLVTPAGQTISAPITQLSGHSTIDIGQLGQLGQALANSQQSIQQIQLPVSGAGPAIQTLVAMPTTMATTASGSTSVPVTVAASTILSKSWTPTTTFATFR